MSGERTHPRDELQQLLDGRLADGRREEVERHIAGCSRCRDEIAALRWLKNQVAPKEKATAPTDLERRVRAALDAEDARRDRRVTLAGRWIAAAATIALAVAAGLWLRPASRADLASRAAASLAAVERGAIRLEHATTDATALERWFDAAELGFKVHVYDLAKMQLPLAGGSRVRFAGGPAALFFYRAADGSRIVCEMYRGSLADLPEDGATYRRDDGLLFRVYERDGATLVFWQEGEVVCFLAGRLGAEAVTSLAFAKAMRV